MNKIFATLAVIFTILSIVSFRFFHVRSNPAFDQEINDSVKELVSQLIRIKYRTHDEEALEKIFTEELIENLDNIYPDFFQDVSFYFVNGNYMRTLYYYDDNLWYVIVRIYEGLLFKNSFQIAIGITQREDGTYVISFVGKDS